MNNTNLRNKYFTFIIAMLSVFQIQAQTDITDWESSFQTIEDVDEEEVENWEMQYEELSDLIEHKIDINSATREDLLRLPFLSNQQGYGHHGIYVSLWFYEIACRIGDDKIYRL